MVDTRRKLFGELTSKQKLFSVIIPTAAALWSIFGGMYSFSQAVLAYSTLSSTAADVFSMAANFESAPIIDATLSTVACADLAASSGLAWEGLTVMDRFKKTGASISGSNEKDRSFTGRWQGAAAYCMCGTKDFPARTAAEKQAMKHTCNATTYDVSKDESSLGCLKSSSSASGTATGGNTNAGGSTVNTGNDGTIYSHLVPSGTCNATSLAQSCVTIPKADGIDLVKLPNVWGYSSQPPAAVAGKYFCVRRAAKAWKDYSITSKATDCASTEVFCGTFCFDKKEIDGKCPVESFDIVKNAAPSNGVTVNRLSSSATTASGANSTATPVVNVVLGRGRPCYGYNGGEGMGYPKQSFSAIPNLKEADNGWTDKGRCSYKNTGTTEESKATGVDTRYKVSARFDQWSLYSANGVAANGVETKVGVVGTNTSYTMYNPYLAVESGTEANVNAGTASMWTLATRGGLYWKPECAADATKQRGDVTENKDPITQLVNLHYWLMFTQGFFGLFIVGIVLGITTLYSMHSPNQDCPCVKGEGGLELQRISKFKTICGTIANVIKVPVLLFCVSVTGAAGSIFARFNGCAGDEISNRSFKSISEMIMAADAADTRALYIDLATLLYTLIMSVMAWRKGCKPNYAIMRQPPEGWDDDQKKDVELGDE